MKKMVIKVKMGERKRDLKKKENTKQMKVRLLEIQHLCLVYDQLKEVMILQKRKNMID